jgi:Flp pilus assembly protein CpaB
MRGGRILIIVGIVGVVLALILGGIWLIGRLRPAAPAPETGEGDGEEAPAIGDMREIVVAAQEKIPRGHRITEEEKAVQLAPWPEEAIPDDALFELESAYGQIARVDIPKNMPVTKDLLTDDAGDLAAIGSEAAMMIPSGKVGYAIAVAGNASVAWAIQPGDHVDVLISLLFVDLDEEFQTETPNLGIAVTIEGGAVGLVGRLEVLPDGTLVMMVPSEPHQRPRLVTQLTVQNAQVLHIGSWEKEEVVEAPPADGAEGEGEGEEEAAPATPPPPLKKWVTLAVTPQEAAVLKYAEEVGASIDFVLRSVDDHAESVEFSITAVTLDYIVTEYGIEAPTKLPYGVTPPVESLRPGASGEVVGEEAPAGTVEYSRSDRIKRKAEEPALKE